MTKIEIDFEDAQRIFDLAVDSPLVCSGSFETDDVVVLRRLADLIGADPAAATPEAFLRDFPHTFKPFNVDLERDEVRTGQLVAGREELREETDGEVYARLGSSPDRCEAGSYNRRCHRPEGDPLHQVIT